MCEIILQITYVMYKCLETKSAQIDQFSFFTPTSAGDATYCWL